MIRLNLTPASTRRDLFPSFTRLLRVEDVMGQLGCHRPAAYEHMEAIGLYRVGRLVRVSQAELEEYQVRRLGIEAGLHPMQVEFYRALGPIEEAVDPESGSWVYFVRAENGGPVKIGSSADPERRRARLQTGSSAALTLAATIPGGRDLESVLHQTFAGYRLHGEWFQRCDVIDWIIAWARRRYPRG